VAESGELTGRGPAEFLDSTGERNRHAAGRGSARVSKQWRNRLLVVAEIILVAGPFIPLVPAVPTTLGQAYSPYPTAIVGTAMLCLARVVRSVRGSFSFFADFVYLGAYGMAAVVVHVVTNEMSMAAASRW
jgi:hypothetical protein